MEAYIYVNVLNEVCIDIYNNTCVYIYIYTYCCVNIFPFYKQQIKVKVDIFVDSTQFVYKQRQTLTFSILS